MSFAPHIFGRSRLLALTLFVVSAPGCAEDEEKVAWPASERELVEAQAYAALDRAPVPIDVAIRRLGQRGRGHDPLVAPQPSEDQSAVMGWSGFGPATTVVGEVGMPAECENEPNAEACWGAKLRNTKGCVACHQIDGATQQPGPNWKGIFGKERSFTDGTSAVADEAYLRGSIMDPWSQLVTGYGKVMPPIALHEDEVNALVAYIKTLQ